MISCLFSPINLAKLPPPSILQRSLILDRDSSLFPSSSMESFALPKLRSPPTADRCLVSVVEAIEEEEESFFELEFTLPDYDEDRKIGRIGDFISGEGPDPRTNKSKPLSTMSILRQSAPKLRVFMFGKPIKRSKTEKSSSQAPQRKARVNFTVKLRIDDAVASKKKFGRSDSSKGSSNGGENIDRCSRRFSKDSVHKYLKPLYVKLASTNSTSKQRESYDSAAAASFSSPRKSEERASSNGKFGVPVKKLGKSRSAGALLDGAASLPVGLKDDSLAQQNDWIQGAILHCKQSFNNSSPKERRVISRCASDTSHDKSFQRTD